MADLVNNLYSFDEDSMQRLMKDLNYMFTHLDERNVKRIYTEYCDIQSEEGETIIDGPLLLMRAADSTTIRLKMGWDDAASEFLFNLYSSDNEEAISLNSAGKAVFKGTINTDEDIYIGGRLFVGWNESTVGSTAYWASTEKRPRAIYLMQPGTTHYGLNMYYWNYGDSDDPRWRGEVESSAETVFASKNGLYLISYAGIGEDMESSDLNTTDVMSIFT